MSKATQKTIGSVAEGAIRMGATNVEALEAVKSEFPKSKTSMPCIQWYRTKLRKSGAPVPTAREARRWEQALA